MTNNYTVKDIPLLKLRNDHRNPRHPEFSNQVEIIEWMLREYGQEIFNLAEDIVEKGLNPIENMLSISSDKEKDCFIVVEGNRRLIAIRLLHNPSLSPIHKWEKKFADLSAKNKARIPKSIAVTIAPSREDVQWILDRRHRGEDEGRGLKRWNTQQAARAQRLRDGQAARYERALNVIDYAIENSVLGVV